MTDIEQKALAPVNEVAEQIGEVRVDAYEGWSRGVPEREALCRAIEQHEAFRQEVSDAVGAYMFDPQSVTGPATMRHIQRFIIAKPDPLVEALEEWINSRDLDDAASFRAAIEKRGGKIVWGEG